MGYQLLSCVWLWRRCRHHLGRKENKKKKSRSSAVSPICHWNVECDWRMPCGNYQVDRGSISCCCPVGFDSTSNHRLKGGEVRFSIRLWRDLRRLLHPSSFSSQVAAHFPFFFHVGPICWTQHFLSIPPVQCLPSCAFVGGWSIYRDWAAVYMCGRVPTCWAFTRTYQNWVNVLVGADGSSIDDNKMDGQLILPVSRLILCCVVCCVVWQVIQRRGDYGLPRENFSVNWRDYKLGFGQLDREFWFGNDFIHRSVRPSFSPFFLGGLFYLSSFHQRLAGGLPSKWLSTTTTQIHHTRPAHPLR